MKYNIDKSLIKAYKSILITKLKDSTIWSIDSAENKKFGEGKKYGYSTTIYDNRTAVRFIIKLNTDIELHIGAYTVYIFKLINNLDLLPKIFNFYEMKKHENVNKDLKIHEELMKRHLPDDYKRAVKISKIKSKI